MKQTKGFSLIELLVVISIIGILIAVVLPRLDQAKSKSRDQKRVSDISLIQLALGQYIDRYGQYPATLSLLVNPPVMSSELPQKPFLPELPTDPVTKLSYVYAAYAGRYPAGGYDTSVCVGYHLGSTLENYDAVLEGDSDTGDAGNSTCGDLSIDFPGSDNGSCQGGTGHCFDVKK